METYETLQSEVVRLRQLLQNHTDMKHSTSYKAVEERLAKAREKVKQHCKKRYV